MASTLIVPSTMMDFKIGPVTSTQIGGFEIGPLLRSRLVVAFGFAQASLFNEFLIQDTRFKPDP